MFLPVIKPIFRIALRIASFILFGLMLISAYAGRINPDIIAIPQTLTLALPYFAIATAIVTVIWLGTGRIITAAIGVLALVLAWAPISTAFPMHFSKKADNPDRTFTLLTYNIIHGWDQQTPDYAGNRSFEYVIRSGADLVGLQEVGGFDGEEIPNFDTAVRDSLFKVYPYHAGTPGTDLKVLSKYPVRLVKNYFPDGGGQVRFALFEVRMPWGKLSWINMHMNSYSLTEHERDVMKEVLSVKDTKDGMAEIKGSIRQKLSASFKERARHSRQLAEALDEIKGPLIVSGDFNDVPESYAYRILRNAGLKDAYVDTSFGPLITYNRHGFLFHLDQIFYKGDLKPLKVEKGTLKSSDHYPVEVTFEAL